MAEAKIARVVAVEPLDAGARRFDLERADGAPLSFVGGQYVIADTGVTLPDGKRAKRAYSLACDDGEARRFSICVKRVGPGSSALLALGPGDTFSFSGPWGKLAWGGARRGLVVATDTGITAAIGLARARGAPDDLAIAWYVDPRDPFVAVDRARALLGRAADRLTVIDALPVRHPERAAHAIERLGAIDRGERALLAGDGAVLHPLRDGWLRAGGGAGTDVDEAAIGIECFFHNPARKAP